MFVTKHAQERIKQRGATVEQIIECLTNGHKMVNRHDSNKWTFHSKESGIFVVTDKKVQTLITVFWRTY